MYNSTYYSSWHNKWIENVWFDADELGSLGGTMTCKRTMTHPWTLDMAMGMNIRHNADKSVAQLVKLEAAGWPRACKLGEGRPPPWRHDAVIR